MPPFNARFEKLMWSFLVKSIILGLYGPRLYVAKKLFNGYILAFRARNQKTLLYEELLRERAFILDYQKLKGGPIPQTSIEFTAIRSKFFNALPKCRCLTVNKGSITLLKNYSQYNFHPEKNYKYYLFTCEPRSLPDWPVNLIEETGASDNNEQEVPRSPKNILEQAMEEMHIDEELDNVQMPELINQSRSSSLDEDTMKNEPKTPASVSLSNCEEQFIDPNDIMLFPVEIAARNSTDCIQYNLQFQYIFQFMKNNEGNFPKANRNNAVSEVSNTDAEIRRVFCPVVHAAKQEPPGANAVALFTSQQAESDQGPSNPTDMIVDTPETPEKASNEGDQRGGEYTVTYDPKRKDLTGNTPGSQPLVGASLEFYTRSEVQTTFDPSSFLNQIGNSMAITDTVGNDMVITDTVGNDMAITDTVGNDMAITDTVGNDMANYDFHDEVIRRLNEPPQSVNDVTDPDGNLRDFNDMDLEYTSMKIPRGSLNN